MKKQPKIDDPDDIKAYSYLGGDPNKHKAGSKHKVTSLGGTGPIRPYMRPDKSV